MKTYSGFKVLTQAYSCSNNTPHVEYCPKYADEFPFVVFGRISQHERTLSGPEQARRDAEKGTGDNDEYTGSVMNIVDTRCL